MNKAEEKNHSQPKSGSVSVTVMFITLMQRYSGQREIRIDLPSNPSHAIDTIIKQFHIPWKDNLEKSTRIFINKQFSESYIRKKEKLKTDDVIAFIPISGGG